MLKTYKILISGQVQGVGFRPYVYGLANHTILQERFPIMKKV